MTAGSKQFLILLLMILNYYLYIDHLIFFIIRRKYKIMSYNKQEIKEVFDNPGFQELIENKDWDILIEEGYFNDVNCSMDLASFIIQELKYPLLEQLDEIPECCFYWDENIQGDFIIPENVTRIGKHAFDGCMGLTSITIPPDMIHIRKYAFHNCKNLKDVYYKGTREEWNKIYIDEDNDDLLNANFHQI